MSERESNINLAKVYIQQAHLTKHRDWSFTLLKFAANRRVEIMRLVRLSKLPKNQGELF